MTARERAPRVLHVIPSIAPRYGGPSVAMREMAAALTSAGADVTVATTDADGPSRLDVPLDRPVIDGGASYRYFARSLPGEWKFSVPLTRWLNAHSGDFDVVHVHALFSYATIPGCRAARRAGVPYVLRPLGTLGRWSLGRRGWKKRPYLAMVEGAHLRHAAAIHATSESEAEGIAALGYGDRVRTIPMGVTVPPETATREGRSGPLRLLFLSRIHPGKGLPLLFDAMARSRAAGVATDLTVAGDGDAGYVATVRAAAESAGVSDSVRFVGRVEGAAKSAVIAEADAFVLPSSHENFGIAVAEALAAGLPVVISDQVGIAADVLGAGAGLVVPLDAGALAGAIQRMAVDGPGRLAMGAAGRRLASDRYSWDEQARRLLALYEDVRRPVAGGVPARGVQ